MEKLIKSPLNYTGNKYRILDQIMKYFPKDIDCMIDMFCGGATVGLNVKAKKTIFIDSNERIIDLLVFLSKQSGEQFLRKLESLIDQYCLSYSFKRGYSVYRQTCGNTTDNNGLKDYNSAGYYKLRDYYNSLEDKNTDEANTILYLLMVYAFNNDIRFNSRGEFNLPIGKTDLNKMNVNKIYEYISRVNELNPVFVCSAFNSQQVLEYVREADFIYMDPPYLLGDAVYNSSWDYSAEYALLDFMDYLLAEKKRFVLSNVYSKLGKTNEPLAYWCHKHSNEIIIVDIDYNYRSASYNKKTRDAKEREVIIVNKV